MFSDVRIGFRIPKIVIDPVGDSGQAITAGAQKPIKTVAPFGRLNLARVTGTDGRKRIGRDDAGLQRRRRVRQHKVATGFSEPQPPEILRIEGPLISEVVDRKQRARPFEKFIATPSGAQLD